VSDAAHARQLLTDFEREGGLAARRADELQAEQARVRNLLEGFAQTRDLVRRKLPLLVRRKPPRHLFGCLFGVSQES
jgi:hypothetical protein